MPKARGKKNSDDALTALLADVEDSLVKQFPEAVRARKFRDPIYGMILIYSGTDTDIGGSSPTFLLPSVSFRDEIEQNEHRRNWSYMLWSACEVRNKDGVYEAWCDDPGLQEKFEQLFELTIGGDVGYAPVHQMFQRVVRRLNEVEWSGILPVSDDFIVFASDDHDEMTDGSDELIPADRLALLRERGRFE